MTADLTNFEKPPRPGTSSMEGGFVRLEPIVDGSRFDELYSAFTVPGGERLWDFLGYGPFPDRAAFMAFAERTYRGEDPLFHAVVPKATGRAEGVASLMRIDQNHGVVEIGHICLAPALQKTRAMTEAFYLFFARVFDELGYRRFEWKCDDRNGPSKRAAERLGFTYEGTFRQHMVVKGRNRDTAWFSALDGDWPRLKRGFEAWLSDDNFDAGGRQRRSLAEIRETS